MRNAVINKSTKMGITLWVWCITDSKVRIGHRLKNDPEVVNIPYKISFV